MKRFLHVKIRCTSFVALAVFIVAGPIRAQSSASPAKELTVERIYSAPSLSGHLTDGIEWTPDSRHISYIVRNGSGPDAPAELWTMDGATGERKVLVGADALKAVTQPEKQQTIQSTGLGRVSAESYMWAPDGKAILFAGSSRLVLLDLGTMKPKTIVSGEQDVEDPKFSPDGKWISFVRDSNLWVANICERRDERADQRRKRRNSEGEARLGVPRRTERFDCVLVVARFDEDRLLRDGRAARDALSDHGHELGDRRDAVHTISASGRGESDCARRRGGGDGGRNEMDGYGCEHGCVSGARELAAGRAAYCDSAS